jgi:hypothetical protein
MSPDGNTGFSLSTTKLKFLVSLDDTKVVGTDSVSLTTVPAPTCVRPSPGLLRLLRPSLTDVLFAGILLWSFILADGSWGRLLRDADAGLHIRIGDYILQTGHIPTTDPFSFTRTGAPWYATEWLSAVLFSTLNASFGLKGIVFVCGVTIVATLLIILRTCLLAGGNALLAVLLTLFAANASAVHYLARPHVFTWLFLAISGWLLMSDRIAPTRRVWLLVPLAALWANLHGGFAILFLLLACSVVGALARGGRGVGTRACRVETHLDARSPQEPRVGTSATSASEALVNGSGEPGEKCNPGQRALLLRYIKLTAACGLACLVNPFGYRLLLETIAYLRNGSIRNTVAEFLAPDFRSEAHIYFMALLFAGLAVSGFLLAKRRAGDALLIVGLAACALTSVRHIPIYAICVVPVIAGELTEKWSLWVSCRPRRSTGRAIDEMTVSLRDKMRPLSLWTVALLAFLFLAPSAGHWPSDFDSQLFPVEIENRRGTEMATARLFTTDQWADYLMYRNPAQRVFLDDRYFYGDRIVNDALKLMDGRPGWRGVLTSYGINAVLAPRGTTLTELLAEDKGWTLVDRDAAALLFRKAD